MNEEWLIKACKKSSTPAQRYLYIQYGAVVKAICYRYIANKAQANDVFHDCFLKILSNIGKYNFQGSFEGWLKRVTVNFCLDVIKKESRQNNVMLEVDSLQMEEEERLDSSDFSKREVSIDDVLKIGFSKEELIEMIFMLDSHYRIVFSLFEIDGFSHKEIALKLHIEEKTSRSRLARAKNKLREIIKERTLQKVSN